MTKDDMLRLFHYNRDTGVFTRRITTGSRARRGDTAGSLTKEGYLVIGICGKNYKCHRLAWLYEFGVFPAGDIDHINQDRADNRISNLRDVTRSRNCQNRNAPRADNKLGVQGVVFHKGAGKYQATITVGGKQRHIGYYETKEDAAVAYQQEKRKHHIQPHESK